MMPLNSIRVASDGIDTEVHVDGKKAEGVEALEIRVDSQTRTPVVSLQVRSTVDLDVLGIAQVVREPTFGEMMHVASEWLEAVDAEQIRAVLQERMTTLRQDPVSEI